MGTRHTRQERSGGLNRGNEKHEAAPSAALRAGSAAAHSCKSIWLRPRWLFAYAVVKVAGAVELPCAAGLITAYGINCSVVQSIVPFGDTGNLKVFKALVGMGACGNGPK